jgi:hypothetical protein
VEITRSHFRAHRHVEGEEDLDLAALLQCLQSQIADSGRDNVIELETSVVLTPGQPVYSQNVSKWGHAKADTDPTAICTGLCLLGAAVGFAATVQTVGPIVLTIPQWTAVTGEAGGLTPGSTYWLDPSTAGRLTKAVPATGYQTQVGEAQTTTTFTIKIWEPIRL